MHVNHTRSLSSAVLLALSILAGCAEPPASSAPSEPTKKLSPSERHETGSFKKPRVGAEPSKALRRSLGKEPALTATAPAEPVPGHGPEPFEAPKPARPHDTHLEEPEAPSFEPELGSSGGLEVRRLITAPDIEAREPVAATAQFGHHDKVYAFIDTSNQGEEAKTITVNFIGPGEQVHGGVELSIPPSVPRWRTWAFSDHDKEPGLWRVELRDSEDGTLLGALNFEVDGGC